MRYRPERAVMPVVSVSMPQSLLDRLDEFIDDHGYSGRSEAVREGARGLLSGIDSDAEGPVVCVVAATFDHDTGAESTLSALRHRHSDLVSSNVHSHAGGDCLEVFVTEGETAVIESFLARVRAVEGVRSVEHSILPTDGPLPDRPERTR